MNVFSLILYGAINLVMVLWHLRGKGRFYEFPFWAGVIALGWFFPQAIGGYLNRGEFPEYAYSDAISMLSESAFGAWI